VGVGVCVCVCVALLKYAISLIPGFGPVSGAFGFTLQVYFRSQCRETQPH
jgi:hypothetical protein